jgi:hypothetical protein
MRRILAAALVAAACSGEAALACGYHGLIGNPFKAGYPGSVRVAIATRGAIESGAIPEPESAVGALGLARSRRWLETLQVRLADRGLPDRLAVLVVNSGLWSRFTHDGRAVALRFHAAGPEQGDQVLLVSEAALAALSAGAMSFDDARQRGLVRLDPGQRSNRM